jgi:hypothetical protein
MPRTSEPPHSKTNTSELTEQIMSDTIPGEIQTLALFSTQSIQTKNPQRYPRTKQQHGQMDLTDIYRVFHPTHSSLQPMELFPKLTVSSGIM